MRMLRIIYKNFTIFSHKQNKRRHITNTDIMRKLLLEEIAYLRKLIDNDALGDANKTLTKEINYLTFLLYRTTYGD